MCLKTMVSWQKNMDDYLLSCLSSLISFLTVSTSLNLNRLLLHLGLREASSIDELKDKRRDELKDEPKDERLDDKRQDLWRDAWADVGNCEMPEIEDETMEVLDDGTVEGATEATIAAGNASMVIATVERASGAPVAAESKSTAIATAEEATEASIAADDASRPAVRAQDARPRGSLRSGGRLEALALMPVEDRILAQKGRMWSIQAAAVANGTGVSNGERGANEYTLR